MLMRSQSQTLGLHRKIALGDIQQFHAVYELVNANRCLSNLFDIVIESLNNQLLAYLKVSPWSRNDIFACNSDYCIYI